MKIVNALVILVVLIGLGYWSMQEQGYQWSLPDGMVPPKVPEDNPMSDAKVELGRFLFYDKKLSANGTTACASCHLQEKAFTDGKTLSVGLHGDFTPRNSMSLTNVAYNTNFTWASHMLTQLEHQALIPLFGEEPPEMGMAGKDKQLLSYLKSDGRYAQMFDDAFDEEEPVTLDNMVKAIASFQRSLLSFNAPYDKYLAGQNDAISDSAKRGLTLFFSEKTECFHCHGGFNFTDSSVHENSRGGLSRFHNNGLYNIDNKGGYPKSDRGLIDLTFNKSDMGKFKSPTLRNIELTAPYMHDGSIATLDAVLDHYIAGGRRIESGPNKGWGSLNPYKSEFVPGLRLTDEEREDLKAFLLSLTDKSFTENPKHSDPWLKP